MTTDNDHKFNLIIPKPMHEELRIMAFKKRMPIAELVREAVERYLEKAKEEEEAGLKAYLETGGEVATEEELTKGTDSKRKVRERGKK